MQDGFIVISGCSGGGKSSVLSELGRRGFDVIEEPGRRIVKEERARGGDALPWIDLAAFARKAIMLALDDLRRAQTMREPVFFDRGLVDAAVALQHATGSSELIEAVFERRYARRIFLAPPWFEIFAGDDDRPHDFAAAEGEYRRLDHAYRRLGHDPVFLPKVDVASRADFMVTTLKSWPHCG